MIKRALAFLLCICSVFCMTAVLAKGETCYVTESFSDEIAECAFNAMKGDGAAYTDSFRSQMNAFELKAYNKLEQKIDFMKKNSGDTIKIDISGMPKIHHGNDDELATLTVPLFTAVYAFEADHPELFWLSKLHAYTYKYNQNNNEIIELYLKASGANGWRSDAFPTEKSVTDAEKKFDDEVNKIINSVKDKGTYGKLEYFNSFIISNCTYNPKVTSGADYTTLGEMP